MRRTYAAVLGLYPAKYQQKFAAEMNDTFLQAVQSCQSQGRRAVVGFVISEATGLLTGLCREWFGRLYSGTGYLRNSAPQPETVEARTEVQEVEQQLADLIESMQFAIANHDFPGARRYSNEERVARAHLNELLSQ